MPIQFIFDRKMKEEEETLKEIFKLTRKEPYPTKETVQLARFVDACFYVIEDVKIKEEERKKEFLRKKQAEEQELNIKVQEEARKKDLEALAPSPIADNEELSLLDAPEMPALPQFSLEDIPSPEKKTITPLAKREYVLQLYESQVGVLVEKEENGIYKYIVIEPYIEKAVLEKTKDMYGKEFERDNSLFDNPVFLKKVAEKVSNRIGIAFSDLLPKKIRYYLERDILGAGVFDPLLYDEKIQEIICDGPNKTLKVNYAGLGIMETNLAIEKNEDLNRFIKRLGNASGKTFNETNPLLDITFQGLKFEGVMGIGGGNSRLTIKRLSQ